MTLGAGVESERTRILATGISAVLTSASDECTRIIKGYVPVIKRIYFGRAL